MSDRWSRLRPRSPFVLDGLIALAMAAFCLGGFLTATTTPQQSREPDLLGVVLVLVATGSLVVRRSFPLLVFVAVIVPTLVFFGRDYPDSGQPFVVLIALYTVASRCDRRVVVAATAVLYLAVVVVVAPATDMAASTIIGTLAVFTLGAVWGDRRKVRDAYEEQLELRAVEKEREQVETARRAVSEERLRIARELHDVVAHAMSVVAVQSGVGAHVIDRQPAEAKRILQTISDASRDTLDEMRRLLGVLRADPDDGDSGEPLAPAPGLDRLAELAARVNDAGVPVEVDVTGRRPPIPMGVDVAAYRIVQEALTNVLKHAAPAHATVRLCYEPGVVRLEVVDDGAAARRVNNVNGAGQGLIGMRERAALYDGELDAGPRPGGGFRVAATLRYGTP